MFAEALHPVALARGLIDEAGGRHRQAWLRPLSGRQEAALASAASVDPRGVSELLATSVVRLGGYADPGPDLLDALTRTDRQRLVLSLRATLFGDRLSLTLRCANPRCRALADLDLTVSSLLPPADEPAPEAIEVDTPTGPAVVREPTGIDDHEVAAAAGTRNDRIARLWARLVVSLDGRPLDPGAWWTLPATTRHALALALHGAPGRPELSHVTRCPECAAWIELHLDPVELLVRELALGAGRLLVEVHALAFHYGWSEADILALTRTRRWRYLELIRRQVEGRPLLGPLE